MISSRVGLLDPLSLAFGAILLAIVCAMASIDFRKMILPNYLNLLLAMCGVTQSLYIGTPDLMDATIGAAIGVLVLSGSAALYRYLRGVEGLGFGDQKFAAAAGLWVGWQGIAPMLLVASVSALVFVAVQSAIVGRFDKTVRVPFGPFLGLGIFVSWVVVVLMRQPSAI